MMNNLARKPLFIVFEGLDRSGKSTQVARLYEYLVGNSCTASVIKFPDRETHIGKMIDSYLKKESIVVDEVIHLLFTANRWENVLQIRNCLANNEIVICDRYSYSGIAYSSAKAHLSFSWCQSVESGLPTPDIVFYMDIAIDKIVDRKGFGNEIYEKRSFQEKVDANFRKLMADTSVNWQSIDATGSADEVHERVRNVVVAMLSAEE